jgi:hypothetical protein
MEMSKTIDAINPDRPLSRSAAGAWLRDNYGLGSQSFLAKHAMIGDGPAFTMFRNKAIYRMADLRSWAESLSGPPKTEAAHRVPKAADSHA